MVLRGVGGEMHGHPMPRGMGDRALQINALILWYGGDVDRAYTGQIADQPRHEAGAGAVQPAHEDIAMCCHGAPVSCESQVGCAAGVARDAIAARVTVKSNRGGNTMIEFGRNLKECNL